MIKSTKVKEAQFRAPRNIGYTSSVVTLVTLASFKRGAGC